VRIVVQRSGVEGKEKRGLLKAPLDQLV